MQKKFQNLLLVFFSHHMHFSMNVLKFLISMYFKQFCTNGNLYSNATFHNISEHLLPSSQHSRGAPPTSSPIMDDVLVSSLMQPLDFICFLKRGLLVSVKCLQHVNSFASFLQQDFFLKQACLDGSVPEKRCGGWVGGAWRKHTCERSVSTSGRRREKQNCHRKPTT